MSAPKTAKVENLVGVTNLAARIDASPNTVNRWTKDCRPVRLNPLSVGDENSLQFRRVNDSSIHPR